MLRVHGGGTIDRMHCARILRITAAAIALSAAGCAGDAQAPSGAGATTAAVGTSSAPAVQAAQPPSARSRASSRQPAYRGPLPSIPTSAYAAAPPDVLRAVYEFAARRPDVMRYVPCFCGCERNGHQDNEDCFVAGRAEDGKPQWDAHGLT